MLLQVHFLTHPGRDFCLIKWLQGLDFFPSNCLSVSTVLLQQRFHGYPFIIKHFFSLLWQLYYHHFCYQLLTQTQIPFSLVNHSFFKPRFLPLVSTGVQSILKLILRFLVLWFRISFYFYQWTRYVFTPIKMDRCSKTLAHSAHLWSLFSPSREYGLLWWAMRYYVSIERVVLWVRLLSQHIHKSFNDGPTDDLLWRFYVKF